MSQLFVLPTKTVKEKKRKKRKGKRLKEKGKEIKKAEGKKIMHT